MHFKLPYVCKVHHVVKHHEQFISGCGALGNKMLLSGLISQVTFVVILRIVMYTEARPIFWS